MSDSSAANEVSVLLRRRLVLYDEETIGLLRKAYEWAKYKEDEEQRLYKQEIGDNTIPVLPKKALSDVLTRADGDPAKDFISDGSDDENEHENGDGDGLATIVSDDEESSSSTHENENEKEAEEGDESNKKGSPQIAGEVTSTKPIKSAKTPKPSGKQQKRLIQDIHKHADNLIRIDLGLPPPTDGNAIASSLHLFPPAALLPKNELREPTSVSDQAHTFLALSEKLSLSNGITVVLLIQSGRFGAGVFHRGKCLAHRATTRYTIRKGQGKAQSTQDGSRRPKSVGSQLRRAGEEQLDEDVKQALTEWTQQGYIDKACLVFLSCPKTMHSTIFCPLETKQKNKNKTKDVDVRLSKDDERIRKVPFDAGRATFHNAQVVYKVLMGVDLCHVENHKKENETEKPDSNSAEEAVSGEEVVDPEEEKRKRKEELAADLPMTPLHTAARDGNLTLLLDLVHKSNHSASVESEDYLDIDQPAGYDCMTPLHFAAASSKTVDPATASALVSALLVQAHADPTALDANRRPPYFLACHDKVREAFRKARAVLGENYCDWDGRAKVGPPLTEDDLEAKKQREAEKKRRKKARAKEKKAKDKVAAEEAETKRRAEEEAKRAAEEAKRVRDGLSSKPTGTNVCDFCHKVCKGRNASKNMFRRLDYKYCGPECVNKHKRELMAAAAMARFG